MPGQIDLDLSPSSVHLPGALKGAQATSTTDDMHGAVREMTDLKAHQRNALPSSKFGDPKNRKYPLLDKAHADNAAARLEQEKASMPAAQYRAIKRRIVAAQKRFGEKKKKVASRPMRGAGFRVTVDHPKHGRIEVRHMSASSGLSTPCGDISPDYVTVLRGAFEADEKATKAERENAPDAVQLRASADELTAASKAPVWNQLAKPGKFLGHPSGPFAMTAETFRQIIENFKSQANRYIPIDFDHASEQPPTAGTRPTTGSPAQGWIRDLAIRNGELWGLVEWGDLARQYIRENKYRYFSPAIRFESRDRVTGELTGARMSSGGLTNDPFLDGMQPLAASRADGAAHAEATTTPTRMSMQFAEPSNKYMPKIRAALRMSELSGAAECADELERLSDAHGEGGGADIHGIPVQQCCMDLCQAIGAPPHMQMEEVFDAVRAMIQAAIDEHVAIDHPSGPVTNDAGGEDADEGDDMSRQNNATAASRGAHGATNMATIQELEAKNATLSAKVTELEAKNNELTLKLNAETTAKTTALARTTELEAVVKKHDDEKIENRVALALLDHGATQKLTPEHKPMLMSFLQANPDGFEKLYPPCDPKTRHLSANLTNANTTPGAGGGGGQRSEQLAGDVTISVRDLAKRIARERGITLAQAQNIAMTMARKQHEAAQ